MNTNPLPVPDDDYLPPGDEIVSEASLSGPQIRRLLRFLVKYWWVTVLTLSLGLAGGVTFVLLTPPTYTSTASMWETVKLRLPGGAMFSEDEQNSIGTQTGLLKSGLLREQALARLRATANSFVIPRSKAGEPLPVAITVKSSTKSSVYQIDAASSAPEYTQKYLDALMQVYLEYKKNIRQVVSGDTLNSISEQVSKAERDLHEQQDALTAFQRTNNLAILQEEGTIAGGHLAKLQTQLSDLQMEARLLDAAARDQEKAAAGDTNAVADWRDLATSGSGLPAATAGPQRQTAFQEIQLLKLQRERLSQYLRPKHPKIVKLDADIERGERLQQIFQQQSRDQIGAAQQANQMKTENVVSSIKEWELKVMTANNRIAEAGRLKLNVERVQSVYDRLVVLVQNVGISRNIDQESLAILEPASAPVRSYLKEITASALSVAVGLALGVGIVFLVTSRDDRFTSAAEVKAQLGDVVVGMLPAVKPVAGYNTLPLLKYNDERHLLAESYRSLRSALLFLATGGERPRILLITSALPHEGKSTVAANLAHTLAFAGSRVLLVDGDLRRGHLHQALELKSEPGLSELLLQLCTQREVLQTNSLSNLSFLARGHNDVNPGDLFLGAGLDAIFARWRQEFDYVLIDSGPLFATDDASCLAPKVDGTLLVVRNNHSGARAVQEALGMLGQRQARVLGVVFNGADPRDRSYRYSQYGDAYAADTPVAKGR